jgi:hypothetical protein
MVKDEKATSDIPVRPSLVALMRTLRSFSKTF